MQKQLKDCHQGQNITVLATLECLEFNIFSCQLTMVADNIFQCSMAPPIWNPFHRLWNKPTLNREAIDKRNEEKYMNYVIFRKRPTSLINVYNKSCAYYINWRTIDKVHFAKEIKSIPAKFALEFYII